MNYRHSVKNLLGIEYLITFDLFRMFCLNLKYLYHIIVIAMLIDPLSYASSNSLLLLGDSVDRGIVHSWCKFHGEGKPIGSKNQTWAISRDWGDGSILYKPQRWIRNTPTHMCENSYGDRITYWDPHLTSRTSTLFRFLPMIPTQIQRLGLHVPLSYSGMSSGIRTASSSIPLNGTFSLCMKI